MPVVNFISILRCFAALIIINSHCAAFYGALPSLGTGGAVGNAIFFFTSGYTLFLGNREIGFGRWFLKRLIRVYPSVWIFLIFSNVFLGEKYNFYDFFVTPFWFVNAIIIFYVLYYAIVKYLPTKIPVIILLLCTPYLLTFFFLNDYSVFLIDYVNNSTCLHWYYYFAIMLYGAYCTNHFIDTKSTAIDFILAMIIYFSIKSTIKYFDCLLIYQFIIPIGLFPICKYALVLSRKLEKGLKDKKKVCWSIGQLAKLTLETYIVQFVIIEYYKNLDLPVRLIWVFITVIFVAIILNRIAKLSRDLLEKLLNIQLLIK